MVQITWQIKDWQRNAMKVKCNCRFPSCSCSLLALLGPWYKYMYSQTGEERYGCGLRPLSWQPLCTGIIIELLTVAKSVLKPPDICASFQMYFNSCIPMHCTYIFFSVRKHWSYLAGSFYFTSRAKPTTQNTITSAPRNI